MEYTKGEWEYKSINEKHWIICDHIEYECVVAEITENIPEMKANAHLIAAAPDMYEACKGVLNWWQKNYDSFLPRCFANVLKALDKAESKP